MHACVRAWAVHGHGSARDATRQAGVLRGMGLLSAPRLPDIPTSQTGTTNTVLVHSPRSCMDEPMVTAAYLMQPASHPSWPVPLSPCPGMHRGPMHTCCSKLGLSRKPAAALVSSSQCGYLLFAKHGKGSCRGRSREQPGCSGESNYCSSAQTDELGMHVHIGARAGQAGTWCGRSAVVGGPPTAPSTIHACAQHAQKLASVSMQP